MPPAFSRWYLALAGVLAPASSCHDGFTSLATRLGSLLPLSCFQGVALSVKAGLSNNTLDLMSNPLIFQPPSSRWTWMKISASPDLEPGWHLVVAECPDSLVAEYQASDATRGIAEALERTELLKQGECLLRVARRIRGDEEAGTSLVQQRLAVPRRNDPGQYPFDVCRGFPLEPERARDENREGYAATDDDHHEASADDREESFHGLRSRRLKTGGVYSKGRHVPQADTAVSLLCVYPDRSRRAARSTDHYPSA